MNRFHHQRFPRYVEQVVDLVGHLMGWGLGCRAKLWWIDRYLQPRKK